MWHLKQIHANNICSFLELDYAPKQAEATLIFGHNQDNDSQNSNGSGKSALIEAIAIAITGESLRKVNIDEIINDTKDEATITAVLYNQELSEQMTINRHLSRKQPQTIQIIKQNGPYDTDTEEISQASVLDYNKYILDQLGLTKDDIFANYILTARKYKSFLASSDKDKKEIINRFSNGVMVDESIESLEADIEPIKLQYNEAEKAVATCIGRVEALGLEIERAINESVERKASIESRIKDWENLIVSKRTAIRTISNQIEEIETSLDKLDSLDIFLQDCEKLDEPIETTIVKIESHFKSNDIVLASDYNREISMLNSELSTTSASTKELSLQLQEAQISLNEQEAKYNADCKTLQHKQIANEANLKDSKTRIEKLLHTVKRIQAKADKILNEERDKKKELSQLENQLAGVITCPNCKYEFIIGANIDIESAKICLHNIQTCLAQLDEDMQANEKEYNKTIVEGKNQREIDSALENERKQIQLAIDSAEKEIRESRRKYEELEKQVEENEKHINSLNDRLSKIRSRLFDDAFNTLDDAYKSRENKIKSLDEEIATIKGSISSYEKAIEEARSTSEKDVLTSLKNSQKKYKKDLELASANKSNIEIKLNELQTQLATFVEFKTYLANTKINAIAQITNEFLSTIGSDIRIALSGYTLLKSGKLRDKISVTLLRDGVDCGSFDKFSAGERVRVELASILSMNQLINSNCEYGKGLDLLIADEVLDSADEQGLACVFKALNKTQITSLIVSHGLISEAYPNKITVVKNNGISTIENV